QAGRGVSLPDSGVIGSHCACKGRVRVPEDEYDIRPLGRDRVADSRPHRRRLRSVEIEPETRLRQPQLVEENLRQLGIVMLPRMQDDLLDSAVSEGDRERRRLYELRAVSDHGEDLQGAGTLGALRAVSSVGREGDS